MNFEGIEQIRFETTKSVMEAMAKVAGDTKAPMADRLKAAKIVDGMSDSVIKAYLLTQVANSTEDSTRKLTNQLGKLIDDDKE